MGLGFGMPFAIGELENLVSKRRLERIQDAQIQEQLRARRASEALAQQEMGLRTRSQDLNEQHRRDQQASLDEQRGFIRANTAAENDLPGDVLSPEDVAERRKYGLGGSIRTIAAQPAGYLQDGDVGPVEERPEQTVARGGSKYLQAVMAQNEINARSQASRDADATRLTETARHNKEMEDIARDRATREQDSAPSLTPEATDMAAKMYARTGQLPPMGMGKAGAQVRQQILNRAASYNDATDSFGGATPDIAGNAAGYSANKRALGALQQNYSATQAFIGTMDRNLELLNQVAAKVTDTGIPLLNLPLRNAAASMGSQDQASFNVLMQSVQGEAARILSNPTLAGQLTDTARREMQSVIAGGATVGQLQAVAKTLVQEAGNRATEYKSQIDTLRRGTQASQRNANTPTNDNDPMGIR